MQQKYSLVLLLTGGGGARETSWASLKHGAPLQRGAPNPPHLLQGPPTLLQKRGLSPQTKGGSSALTRRQGKQDRSQWGSPPPQLPLIWSIESERAVHSSNPHFGGLKTPHPQPQPSSSLSAPSLVLPAPQKPHTPHPAPCTPLPGLITQDCGKIPR